MNLVKHLLQRNYDPSRYQTTWFDQSENAVTFPLYDFGGRLVGYQQYRPLVLEKATNNPKESRYFTYLPKGVDGAFGLHTLNRKDKFVFVQEGVFDCSPLHMLGLPSVAMLGTVRPGVLENLKLQGYTTLTVSDGDPAGKLLASKVDFSMSLPSGKDLGDYTLEEVSSFATTLLSQLPNHK